MNRISKRAGQVGVTIAVAASLVFAGGVAANAADVSGDALAAIGAATPGTVAKAADVATTDSGTNAVDATVAGTDVIVPVDPADGISLAQGASTVSIGLPFAQKADNASVEKPGVVSYDNNNGSTTVPVVQNDGTLQINTVIENPDAPKRYDYSMGLSAGQSLQLSPGGSAYVANENGTLALYIAAPWAKDANGNDLATHYEVSGNTLTQFIGFTTTTVFPVVADPSYGIYPWGYVVKFNRTDTKTMAKNTDISSAGAMCGLIKNVAGSVVCGLLGANGLGAILAPLYSAARHGNCVQSNQPWVPIPPTLYEVTC